MVVKPGIEQDGMNGTNRTAKKFVQCGMNVDICAPFVYNTNILYPVYSNILYFGMIIIIRKLNACISLGVK